MGIVQKDIIMNEFKSTGQEAVHEIEEYIRAERDVVQAEISYIEFQIRNGEADVNAQADLASLKEDIRSMDEALA